MKKTLIALMALAGVAMADSLTLSTSIEYTGDQGGKYCGVAFTLAADDDQRFELTGGELGSQVTLDSISVTERGGYDVDPRVMYVTDSNNTYLGVSAVFTKETGSDVLFFDFGDAITLNTKDTYYAYFTTSDSVADWVVGGTVSGGQYYSVQLAAVGAGNLTTDNASNWGLLNGQKSLASTGFAPAMSIKVNNIPEPTTATLSLLALAGLAARRRRK